MEDLKKKVASSIAAKVQSNTVLAIGAGTTVQAAIEAIGERVTKEKLQIACVTSSLESAWFCQNAGLQVLDQSYEGSLAWGFDGADAVDSKLRAIKGRGAAMLQEKIIAERCANWVLLITENKLVENLAIESVPVEVVPIAYKQVRAGLIKLGAENVTLRSGSGKAGPIITEQGNIILDVKFAEITNNLDREIKALTGVIETGLFLRHANEVLVAGAGGVRSLKA